MAGKYVLDVFGEFAFRLISKKIQVLVSQFGFNRDQRDDLYQDFALDLCAEAPSSTPRSRTGRHSSLWFAKTTSQTFSSIAWRRCDLTEGKGDRSTGRFEMAKADCATALTCWVKPAMTDAPGIDPGRDKSSTSCPRT